MSKSKFKSVENTDKNENPIKSVFIGFDQSNNQSTKAELENYGNEVKELFTKIALIMIKQGVLNHHVDIQLKHTAAITVDINVHDLREYVSKGVH